MEKTVFLVRRLRHALLEILFIRVKPCNRWRSRTQLSEWTEKSHSKVVAKRFGEVHGSSLLKWDGKNAWGSKGFRLLPTKPLTLHFYVPYDCHTCRGRPTN